MQKRFFYLKSSSFQFYKLQVPKPESTMDTATKPRSKKRDESQIRNEN
jgi:hypothetical protein